MGIALHPKEIHAQWKYEVYILDSTQYLPQKRRMALSYGRKINRLATKVVYRIFKLSEAHFLKLPKLSRSILGAIIFYTYLYLKNEDNSRNEILELVYPFISSNHSERPAFQNKWIAVFEIAFQVWKVYRSLKKQALGPRSVDQQVKYTLCDFRVERKIQQLHYKIVIDIALMLL